MNPSKSTGRHGIPAKYIKMSGSVIAPVPTNIFNACISTGYFPKVLKTAEVVPIFKKGERELCSNYRPISISPYFYYRPISIYAVIIALFNI